jgi:alkylated DNA repair dioxygenase AlkB
VKRRVVYPGFTLLDGFLTSSQAYDYFHRIHSETLWEQRSIRIFGKLIPQPRLLAWQGTEAYTYSGQTLLPAPFGNAVAVMLERVSFHCRVDFNSVLLNYYRNGLDSMGLHADDEPELGPQPFIASLSLGAERKFRIVPRNNRIPPQSFLLSHGSLLLMYGDSQALTKHELPKMRALKEGRINLTFRKIISKP